MVSNCDGESWLSSKIWHQKLCRWPSIDLFCSIDWKNCLVDLLRFMKFAGKIYLWRLQTLVTWRQTNMSKYRSELTRLSKQWTLRTSIETLLTNTGLNRDWWLYESFLNLDFNFSRSSSALPVIFRFDDQLIEDTVGKLQPNQLTVDNLTVDWLRQRITDLETSVKECQEKQSKIQPETNGKISSSASSLPTSPTTIIMNNPLSSVMNGSSCSLKDIKWEPLTSMLWSFVVIIHTF